MRLAGLLILLPMLWALGGCDSLLAPCFLVIGAINRDLALAKANGKIELEGQVVTADGRPLEGVQASIETGGLSPGPCFGLETRFASPRIETLPDGRFRWSFAKVSHVIVTWARPGYGEQVVAVSFGPQARVGVDEPIRQVFKPDGDRRGTRYEGPKPVRLRNLRVVLRPAAATATAPSGP